MINREGIIFGDIFWLDFFGLNLFIGAKKVCFDKILGYEVKTKKINKTKEIPIMFQRKSGSKFNDKYYNSYELNGNVFIDIKIDENSEIYKKCKRIEKVGGIYRAVLISQREDFYNLYFNRE